MIRTLPPTTLSSGSLRICQTPEPLGTGNVSSTYSAPTPASTCTNLSSQSCGPSRHEDGREVNQGRKQASRRVDPPFLGASQRRFWPGSPTGRSQGRSGAREVPPLCCSAPSPPPGLSLLKEAGPEASPEAGCLQPWGQAALTSPFSSQLPASSSPQEGPWDVRRWKECGRKAVERLEDEVALILSSGTI